MLPNKLISYKESILPKTNKIIIEIRNAKSISILELYKKTEKHMKDINQYLDVLSFLYAIGYLNYENGELKLC